MKKKNKNNWIMSLTFAAVTFIGIQLVYRPCQGEDYGTRTLVREKLNEKYPEKIHQLAERYGIKPYSEETEVSIENRKYEVVLIHGLDEPGKVWMNLAPALHDQGFNVWVLNYPNDQPIRESAKFVFGQIASIKTDDDSKLAIVAHSMGGLVMREMLTSPQLNYEGMVVMGQFPRVSQLIMVGTPNHGSNLAHLRVFSELREQIVNVFKGEYHWLLPFVDGAGEAGVDLLPGSAFLEDLNSRNYPKELKMTIIAGIMSPIQKENTRKDIDRFVAGLSPEKQAKVNGLIEKIDEFANEVGDGAVSVDSARLSGIPLEIVPGTHLSIIRNLSADSQRVPPAIPIVIRLLKDTNHP